jgi:hypothetical protein
VCRGHGRSFMAYDAAYSGYAIDDSVVGFIEAVELDIASAPYSDLTPSAYGRLLDTHYRDCIKRRTPLMHLIVLDTFNRSRAYARLILPLSEDGETVTMLMTVDSRHQNNDALTDFFTLARG